MADANHQEMNPPRRYEGEDINPRTAKLAKTEDNQRKEDPFSDLEYSLIQLAETWNEMGEATYFHQDITLYVMEAIVQQGYCRYRNQLGPGMGNFADEFRDLMEGMERRGFYELARKCHQENRTIDMVDVRNLLLFVTTPQEPYLIDLQGNNVFENGTKRFPFTTIKSAERSCEEHKHPRGTEVEVIRCAATCTKKVCHFDCKEKVCTKHGLGYGEIVQQDGRTWIQFEVPECKECHVVACNSGRHGRFMAQCTVCSNNLNGDCALTGSYDYNTNCHICKSCSKICKKIIDEDHFDEEQHGKVCGFICCPEHSKNHTCGDDPCDYI
jgi:hypothetical protein